MGGQASPLTLGEVLGHRPAQLAVIADEHVGQALGAAGLGPVLPAVEHLAGLRLAPPGMTTAPTYGAWNTRKVVSAK